MPERSEVNPKIMSIRNFWIFKISGAYLRYIYKILLLKVSCKHQKVNQNIRQGEKLDMDKGLGLGKLPAVSFSLATQTTRDGEPDIMFQIFQNKLPEVCLCQDLHIPMGRS